MTTESLTTESIRYGAGDEFSGYLAYPTRAKTPLPAVVVIHEAWGIDAHIEDVVNRIAMAGYVALAPDVFAHDGARPEPLSRERLVDVKAMFNQLGSTVMDPEKREAALAAMPEPQQSKLRESFGAMFAMMARGEANVVSVAGAAKHLRETCAQSRGQRVASIGFCMGGGLSALLATADPDLAGAVIFYGMAPREELIPKIACPVIGFYGSLDARVNPGIPAFEAAMKKNGKSFEPHIYEGAQHAFFNDTRPSYDVASARDAYGRVLAFFRARLA